MKVATASSLLARVRGLLGTRPGGLDFDALHITPCKSIHTFGMRYPIDLAFLNKQNQVIQIRKGIAPQRYCRAPKGTVSVLERPAVKQHQPWLRPGQYLNLSERKPS